MQRRELLKGFTQAASDSSIYRTAPITTVNLDTSHCTKNRHFRAIAYICPRAENACAKES